VVIDDGIGQFVTTAAADGTFAIGGVPTLQGVLKVTASLHAPCNVLLVGGPLTVNQLTAGGETAVTWPPLVPDPGPPSKIFTELPFTELPFTRRPAAGERCTEASGPTLFTDRSIFEDVWSALVMPREVPSGLSPGEQQFRTMM
jgi:hypothetical protein